jgi:addiction module RelB/DinJ family antitoxin
MTKTAVITTRIEPTLKQDVESILTKLGITTSQAIMMYFKQISLVKGLPFAVQIPENENTFIDELLASPIKIENFEPLKREAIYER